MVTGATAHMGHGHQVSPSHAMSLWRMSQGGEDGHNQDVTRGWSGVHQDATTTMSTCQAQQTFEALISLRRMSRWPDDIRMSLGVHQDVTQYNADTTELLLTLACVSCVTPSQPLSWVSL